MRRGDRHHESHGIGKEAKVTGGGISEYFSFFLMSHEIEVGRSWEETLWRWMRERKMKQIRVSVW